MRRSLPYLLFAAVTVAVFWKFLLFGHSLYAMEALEAHLGVPEKPPAAWFRSQVPHAHVADSLLLLPLNLRVYNEGLHAGELRLWNPGLFCGYPLYADPMVHPFYPPHLVLHALFAPGTAYELSLLLHLFFSGVTMYWALRALRRSALAATVGGLVWMLFGYTAAWFSAMILLGASVFAPLVLLAVTRGLEKRDLSRAPLAALAMGMTILGSHPQYALHLFILFLVLLGAAFARAGEERRFVVRFSTLFALLSVGIGLVAILARLDTLSNGYRSAGADFEVHYGEPWKLLTYLLGLGLGKVYFPESGTQEFDFSVYAGAAGLTLAIVGARRGVRDPVFRWIVFGGAGALLIAFVRPLAGLVSHVPILNLSSPARWAHVAGFCIAILAAVGVDEAPKELRGVRLGLVAAASALVAACLVGIGPFRFSNGAVLEISLGLGLALGAAYAKVPRLAAGLLVAAVLFDLLPNFLMMSPHGDPALLQATPSAVRFVHERESGAPPWRGTGALGSPFSSAERIFMPELTIGNNMLAWYGVENVAGFEAILPAHYVRFCREAEGRIDPVGRETAFLECRSRLLDLAGLKYVFMPFQVRMDPRFVKRGQFGSVSIYENPAALPRAYVVGGVRAARSEDEAARLLRAREFRPREPVVLETDAAFPSEGGPVEHEVRWLERTSDRLRLEVRAARDGVLVLSETDYPGWEATVDGRPAPIFRANLAFRAVPVAAGTHAVEFRFRPDPVRQGLLGSIVFGLLAVGWAIVAARGYARSRNTIIDGLPTGA